MFYDLRMFSVLLILLNLSPISNMEISKANEVYCRYDSSIESKVEDSIALKTSTRKYKDIVVHITYYTNYNDMMQGGQNDRIGVPLKSHGEPIVAMPSDIPYGSYIDIEGMGNFKVVDTGGAIVWLDENTCKVDVFVPDVDPSWLVYNTVKESKKAKLYINE